MADRERDYDDEGRPRRRPRPAGEFEEGEPPPQRKRPRDEFDEEEEDRPVRRRRPRDEFDEDDYEERPRRRRRRRDVAPPSAAVTLVGIVNLIFAGLVVIWCLAIIFFGSVFMAWMTGVAADPILMRGNPNAPQAARAVQGFAALGTAMFIFFAVLLFLLGAVPMGLAGIGVLKRQQWGRVLTLILGGFAILGAISCLIEVMRQGPGFLVLAFLDAAYGGLTYGILLQPQFAEEFE
jgi:hypothetical protein